MRWAREVVREEKEEKIEKIVMPGSQECTGVVDLASAIRGIHLWPTEQTSWGGAEALGDPFQDLGDLPVPTRG